MSHTYFHLLPLEINEYILKQIFILPYNSLLKRYKLQSNYASDR